MPNTEPESGQPSPLHVAVGVIVNSAGEILIALRPSSKHQGGLWEFPGGKVEPRETVEAALDRELREELGIGVRACRPLVEICHDYPDRSVRLDVWWVDEIAGQPCGREGQAVRWVPADQLHQFEFPAANQPIITAITAVLSGSTC